MVRVRLFTLAVLVLFVSYFVSNVQAEPAPVPPVSKTPTVESQSLGVRVTVPDNWKVVATREHGPFTQTMYSLNEMTDAKNPWMPTVVVSDGPIVESIASMLAVDVQSAKYVGYFEAGSLRSKDGLIISTRLKGPDGTVVVMSIREFSAIQGRAVRLTGWLQKEKTTEYAMQMQKVLLDMTVKKK